MKPFYFTFGFSHPLSGHYLRVVAPDWEAARLEMVSRHGLKWAFQYTEEEFLPLIPRHNLTEIKE